MAKAIQVLLKKDAWEMKPVRAVEKMKNVGNAPFQDGKNCCQAELVALYCFLNHDHSGCGLQDLVLE